MFGLGKVGKVQRDIQLRKPRAVQVHFDHLLSICMIHLTLSISKPYLSHQKRMLVHNIACISPSYRTRIEVYHNMQSHIQYASPLKKKARTSSRTLSSHAKKHFYPTCFGTIFPFRFGSGFLTYATPLLMTLSSLGSFVLVLAPP